MKLLGTGEKGREGSRWTDRKQRSNSFRETGLHCVDLCVKENAGAAVRYRNGRR